MSQKSWCLFTDFSSTKIASKQPAFCHFQCSLQRQNQSKKKTCKFAQVCAWGGEHLVENWQKKVAMPPFPPPPPNCLSIPAPQQEHVLLKITSAIKQWNETARRQGNMRGGGRGNNGHSSCLSLSPLLLTLDYNLRCWEATCCAEQWNVKNPSHLYIIVCIY